MILRPFSLIYAYFFIGFTVYICDLDSIIGMLSRIFQVGDSICVINHIGSIDFLFLTGGLFLVFTNILKMLQKKYHLIFRLAGQG